MNASKFSFVAGLSLALSFAANSASAAGSFNLTGTVSGTIKDASGVPQIGANILLYNRYDKIVSKAISNLRGDFSFASLTPDIYSLRVTASSFVPAIKRNILVQPGMQSVLAINLASVFSSVELVYSAPRSGALMSDDWKWVLRTATETRPVLRALPQIIQREEEAIFSDTTGVLRVSSGESNPYDSLGNQPDLGTAFALATSVYGSTRVRLSGNIGYGIDSATPTTGFRTSFSRSEGGVSGPEVRLTVQQLGMPNRAGIVIGSQNAPALRTMSLTMMDRAQIIDGVELEYGASMDSVTFLDRLNYLSPFARLTYDLGSDGRLQIGYSSGAPAMELLADSRDSNASLQQDLAALALLPRVSLRDGRAHVQRTENFEVGYELTSGSRTYFLAGYREFIRNGAVTMADGDGVFASADLLPEFSSRSSVFNLGSYSRFGYSVGVTQALGDDYSVSFAAGRNVGLTSDGREVLGDSDQLRSTLHQTQQTFVAIRANAILPVFGTRVITGYQWTDLNALAAPHVYFTQRNNFDTGLNVRVRQPLPGIFGIPGRLEATADLRNLLAQGYLPIMSDGRRVLLTHTPRTVRGGLSFIF